MENQMGSGPTDNIQVGTKLCKKKIRRCKFNLIQEVQNYYNMVSTLYQFDEIKFRNISRFN